MTTIDSTLRADATRRHTVPIIYTRGTHYEIGFDIGTTFAQMIRNYVANYDSLSEAYLPIYETREGREIYDSTLECVRKQYPQYVREIEGTADGSGVPFHKLFLMHLDDIIIQNSKLSDAQRDGCREPIACTAIICNHPGQEILGHNEDACHETLNHWYLVDAHVIEPGLPEEKFTSLSYAGFLPGFTMGYNHHGLVFSINALCPKTLRPGKTPRYFLTRSLLNAKTYEEAEKILLNVGYGAAEGFAVNMTFLNREGERIFYNAEIGPVEPGSNCSQLDVQIAKRGENLAHCNVYNRLRVPMTESKKLESSYRRQGTIDRYPPAKTKREVAQILSDQSDEKLKIYREPCHGDWSTTICTGIFDCVARTWSIYTGKPDCSEPNVVLPLQLKTDVQKCT